MTDIKKEFGQATPLGKRRTEIGQPPAEIMVPVEALIEREPVTVLCSAKGWIRAVKGHNPSVADLRYKEGDEGKFAIAASTTDKLLLFGSNGRFYTLGVDKLPGGRGHGEPVRLMIELSNEHDIVAMLLHREGQKLLVASSDGRGFVVPADEALAQTRGGKVVMNPADDARAVAVVPAEGDRVAVVGDNHKLLVFPLKEVPEMARGRGVILQRYHDGMLADVRVFRRADGLTWRQGESRTRTETELGPWEGARAQSGRLAPPGFPKTNRFG
jgi:topoisomerase-4 subunit A